MEFGVSTLGGSVSNWMAINAESSEEAVKEYLEQRWMQFDHEIHVLCGQAYVNNSQPLPRGLISLWSAKVFVCGPPEKAPKMVIKRQLTTDQN